MGDAWPTEDRSHEALARELRAQDSPRAADPMTSGAPRALPGEQARSPERGTRGSARRGGETIYSTAMGQQTSRPYRRWHGVLIARSLRNDLGRRLPPCGPDRKRPASFWCREIAQGSLGLLARPRKFPCQEQIMASRSVAEQTNPGFGATGAPRRADQPTPVVDPSVGGACAFRQPQRGRGGAGRSRQRDRRGYGILANARVPIRARADANRHYPQP
jgi:hypothetical protein